MERGGLAVLQKGSTQNNNKVTRAVGKLVALVWRKLKVDISAKSADIRQPFSGPRAVKLRSAHLAVTALCYRVRRQSRE